MIKREASIFLIVGVLTVLCDYTAYKILIYFGTFEYNISKGISFMIGTLFAYFANRFWTFRHVEQKKGNFGKFFILYSLTLAINIVINSLVLKITFDYVVELAFILATLTSATLNFLGMKFYVFKKSTIKEHK